MIDHKLLDNILQKLFFVYWRVGFEAIVATVFVLVIHLNPAISPSKFCHPRGATMAHHAGTQPGKYEVHPDGSC